MILLVADAIQRFADLLKQVDVKGMLKAHVHDEHSDPNPLNGVTPEPAVNMSCQRYGYSSPHRFRSRSNRWVHGCGTTALWPSSSVPYQQSHIPESLSLFVKYESANVQRRGSPPRPILRHGSSLLFAGTERLVSCRQCRIGS